MKQLITFSLFFVCLLSAARLQSMTAPIDTVTWAILNNVEYKEASHEVYGTVYLPTFSKEIQRLNGKEVIIRGYLVPVDKTTWALSKNTYAACFFCGKAGPASVMTVKFKKKNKSYRTDDYVQFKGVLRLNYDDINEFYYILNESEEVK